jgi:hypothetical protein
MADSTYDPSPVSLYFEELSSLQSQIDRKVKSSSNSTSMVANYQDNTAQYHVKSCADSMAEMNFPATDQISISRSKSNELDWHSELILATQTLDAFCIVDRGQLDSDD